MRKSWLALRQCKTPVILAGVAQLSPTNAENNPSRTLDRTAGLSRHNLAEAERIRYMERILQHYVPTLSLDIQSLRKAAEELKDKHRSSDSDAGPSIRLDNEDFEDLAIDDEDFTIKALPDNTTRMSTSPVFYHS